MASCKTSQWTSTSPYVKLTVTQSSSTDTTATLSWTLQYIADSAASTSTARSYSVVINGSTVESGTYSINGVRGTKEIASGTKKITKTHSSQTIPFSCSFDFKLTWSGTYAGTKSASGSISVAAKTKYTVSYNANGGSGTLSSQTKWYGETLTLSSAKPTRTGYTFQGWATSSGGSRAYSSGGSYTSNAGVTLYAVWKANTYTVSYNANGGTGAPASQTKTYGETLTLSSTKPTRVNYIFKGWGTSRSATTISYVAGASYTKNAAITLYAIWELAYTKPVISDLKVFRCDSVGNAIDTGEYAVVSFNWQTFSEVTSILIEWYLQDNKAGSFSVDVSVLSSKNSGTTSTVIGGALSIDMTYTVKVIVTDSKSQDRSITLNAQTFLIDFLQGGNGCAIGKAAEIAENFDVKWLSRFRNHLCIGEKTGHLDGKTGIFLSNEGYMHLQRTTAQNYNPYIAFLRDDETAVTAQIQLDVDTNKLKLLGADGYEIDNTTTLKSHFLVGDKTGYLDGNTGVYVNKDGFIHIQRRSTGNAYIAFLLDSETGWTAGKCAAIALVPDDGYLHFQTSPTSFDKEAYFNGNIYPVANIRFAPDSTGKDAHYIGMQWADGNHHYFLSRSEDGLTSYFGWSGSSSYSTVTTIRGQTCKYTNSSGTTTLSDERLKKDIVALDKWGAFFDALEPCAFKMKAGTSGRYHLGFKAQQVEKALTDSGLTTRDFAGFIEMPYKIDEDDPERSAVYEAAGIKEGETEYGLIYSEFTALNTYKIQQLQKENNKLKNKLADLEERLSKLEALLDDWGEYL